MTGFETLTLTIDPRGVASLTLNRPEKRNAMSALMIDELTAAARTLADSSVRAVVLSGAGPEGIFPGIFGVIHAQRPKATLAAIHDWPGFGRLVEKNSASPVQHRSRRSRNQSGSQIEKLEPPVKCLQRSVAIGRGAWREKDPAKNCKDFIG